MEPATASLGPVTRQLRQVGGVALEGRKASSSADPRPSPPTPPTATPHNRRPIEQDQRSSTKSQRPWPDGCWHCFLRGLRPFGQTTDFLDKRGPQMPCRKKGIRFPLFC